MPFSDIKKKRPEIINLKKDEDFVSRKPKAIQRKQRQLKTTKIVVPELDQSSQKKIWNVSIFLIIGFAVLSALILANIAANGVAWKSGIADAAKEGYKSLIASGLNFTKADIDKTFEFLEKAKLNFAAAKQKLWFLSENAYFAKAQNKGFRSAQAVITAGENLAQSLRIFTNSSERLKILPQMFFDRYSKIDLTLNPQEGGFSITEALKKEIPYFEQSFKLLKNASHELNDVNIFLIPRHLQEDFKFAREMLKTLMRDIGNYKNSIPAILNLLGDVRPHKYLVLMQNNGELRATGGFIGSYMLIEMNDGYLTKNEVHDVYQSDYELKERIEPPAEIATMTDRWFLRDSNYSPHFPVSAQKAAWFLQKEAGPSVDTVIAIDQTFLENLLEITGPVYVPSLNNFIAKENAALILSYIIESKLEGREDPKKIMKEFIPLFQKELFKKASIRELAIILKKLVASRHLMAYSREKDVQQFFEITGADGKMRELKKNDDYLQVVNINFGGNKSDSYIKQTYTHDTFFQSDGSIENELIIEKFHAWNSAEIDKWTKILGSFGFTDVPDYIKDILGRGKNVSFMRIYVPKGSRLISINDIAFENTKNKIEVKEDTEIGKTYFFTKIETEPGKLSKLKIRYRLLLTIDIDPTYEYRFIFQKQMGVKEINLLKRVFPARRMQNLKFLPNDIIMQDNILIYQNTLAEDKILATLWRN